MLMECVEELYSYCNEYIDKLDIVGIVLINRLYLCKWIGYIKIYNKLKLL